MYIQLYLIAKHIDLISTFYKLKKQTTHPICVVNWLKIWLKTASEIGIWEIR